MSSIEKAFEEIYESCKKGDFDTLRNNLIILYNNEEKETLGNLLINKKYKDYGNTALHITCKYGYTSLSFLILNFLTEKEVEILINDKNNEGSTCLMLASSGQILIDNPNIKLIEIPLEQKQKSLLYVIEQIKSRLEEYDEKAIKSLAMEIIEPVSWNFHKNIQSYQDEVTERMIEICKDSGLLLSLIERKVNKNTKSGIFPKQSLHDHRSILSMILLFYKNLIKLEEVDNYNQNIIHYAIRGKYIFLKKGDRWDFIKIIVENGFNMKEFDEKNTYFHHAIEFGATNCVKMFLNETKYAEKYSRILIENIYDDKNDKTLLNKAIKKSNMDNYYEILEFCMNRLEFWYKKEVVGILKKQQEKNEDGKSLLHFAVENSFTKTFELFLKYVDINSVDNNNETCLFVAAKNDDYEFFQYLVGLGIDKKILNHEKNIAHDYLKNFEMN
jgi:ankyrin repeat protein